MKYIILAFLPSVVLATGGSPAPTTSPTPAQQQTQGQSQHQGQGQHQSANSAAQAASAASAQGGAGGNAQASNAGVQQDVNIEDRLQAPSANAPTVIAGSKCATGWSAALSGPGAGLGGGRSKIDPACQKAQDLRDNIALVATLKPSLALKAACRLDGIKEAVTSPEDCTLDAPVVAPPPVIVNAPPPAPQACTKALRQCVKK
jgi:hypothetical protein